MVVGKGELTFNDFVTHEAEVRLRLPEKFVVEPTLLGRPVWNAEELRLCSHGLSLLGAPRFD